MKVLTFFLFLPEISVADCPQEGILGDFYTDVNLSVEKLKN